MPGTKVGVYFILLYFTLFLDLKLNLIIYEFLNLVIYPTFYLEMKHIINQA